MAIWVRLGGALLIGLAAIGLLEYFGAGNFVAARTSDEMRDAAHGRPREVFWLLIFAAVMATSVLAAARRGAAHLRRALGRRA